MNSGSASGGPPGTAPDPTTRLNTPHIFMGTVAALCRLIGIVVIAIATLAAALRAAQPTPPPSDALTRLASQLERGETTLEYKEGVGYLPSLLDKLEVNIDSQTLVFSKTSLQQAIINPNNPRALYFNDEVSVGHVPGGEVFELVALEPVHGLVFYTLDTKKSVSPRLQRRGTECFFCHGMGNKGAPRSRRRDRLSERRRAAGLHQHFHRHDRPSDTLRPALGRLVRHRHTRIAETSRQRGRLRSLPSARSRGRRTVRISRRWPAGSMCPNT